MLITRLEKVSKSKVRVYIDGDYTSSYIKRIWNGISL